MADLKLGTQIGGNLVWHQGILDLNPVDTKLYFQDQEVLVDTGYQTLKGTMKFNVPANQYDIESLSTLPAGSKSMLRRFRGGINDSIWHETIQSDAYRISRGTTDTDLVMQLTGTGATFQGSVLTNAAQSSAANSFTRKDFVNSEDAKKVNKAGDGMTGNLDFNLDNQGIRVKFPGGSVSNDVGVFGGQGDGASRTKTNMQIKSWWGVGFSPSGTGTAVSPGENSIWFDTRNGNMYTVGRTFVGSDQEVYSPLNKPTPGDIDAYTKSEVDEKGWFRVKDERAAMIAPNALQSKTVAAYFTNQSDVTTNWVSGFTVNGWESTYAAWSLFSSARSDADDARLWFKYGRTAWSPSYRIYHENNKPTNVELNLVSRAGDVMTGALDMKVPDSLGFGKYAIKLNSGSIGGINQLVFGDPSDTSSEGILFPKSGKNDQSTLATDYDALYAFDGVLKFNGKAAYGEWNKPTSSDTNSLYVELTSTSVDLNTLGGITDANNSSAGVYRQEASVNATTAKHYPVRLAGTLLVTPSAHGCHQEYTTFTGRKFHRGLLGTFTGTGPWGEWTEFYSEVSPKQFVDKTGDTMTGALIATQFKASSDYGFVRSTNNAQGMFVGGDGRTIIGGGTGALILRPQGISNAAGESVFNNDGTIAISKTGTADNHLVTKKYVDDKVGTAVQSVTAIGAVKSTGGINPVISLANATNAADGAMSFADKAKLDGIPAAAVNRTGDTMTGNLNFGTPNQGIHFQTATIGGGNGLFSGTGDGASSTSSNIQLKSWFGVGIAPVSANPDNKNTIWFNARNGNIGTVGDITANKSLVSAAQGTEANALTRKDYVDSAIAAGDARQVSKAGDTMTGALKWNIANTYISGSGANLYVAANAAGGRVIIEGAATPWARVAGADYEIYHKGNRPTPVEIGAMPILQLNTEDLNTLVIAGVYEQHADANTSAARNYPENRAGSLTITGGAGPKQSYHVYNSSRVYTRAQYSTGAFTAWALTYNSLNKPSPADLGAVNVNQVNFAQDGTWAGVINKIPYIGNGVMEVGKYIDFHDVNSTVDYNVRLNAEASNLAITTPNGTIQIGAMNASYAHIYTDRPTFYFNKEMQVNGSLVLHDGSSSGTLTLDSWIRTTGETGLFCATYGGGIHMRDVTWVRTYNNKKFYVSNAESDAIYTAGGVKADGNGSFNDVQVRSDERLKSNYQPITSALDKVDHLAGITYDKIGKTTREAGIIAQRLKEVLPEATGVVFDSMDADAIEYLTISNSGVNALLVEAIKELTNRVKYLESKLN